MSAIIAATAASAACAALPRRSEWHHELWCLRARLGLAALSLPGRGGALAANRARSSVDSSAGPSMGASAQSRSARTASPASVSGRSSSCRSRIATRVRSRGIAALASAGGGVVSPATRAHSSAPADLSSAILWRQLAVAAPRLVVAPAPSALGSVSATVCVGASSRSPHSLTAPSHDKRTCAPLTSQRTSPPCPASWCAWSSARRISATTWIAADAGTGPAARSSARLLPGMSSVTR